MSSAGRRFLGAALTVAGLLLTAACGSDEAGAPHPRPTAGSPSTSPPPERRTATPTIPAPPPPTPTAPQDPVAAEKDINAGWERFFSPDASVEERAGFVEDGNQYALMIEALATDPESSLLRAHVDAVTFSSDLRATVHYTLYSDGQRVGPDEPGIAVLQDGTWKISFATLCSLTPYGQDVPPAGTCPAVEE
ncbi:hypothetical protein ACH44C_00540 [Streptomyces purpureus]|uniref:hypothetical protein n=1 Tax=Streptomyces purpureus TaxID=1951 RepID=UPI0037BCBBEE